MPTPPRPRRRLAHGTAYAGGAPPSPDQARTLYPPRGELRLSVSPEDLGIIGAELSKRLTMAAEDFLTELVSDQVRGSFRHELGGIIEEEPEE